MMRILLWGVGAVATLYLGILLLVFCVQRSLLFFPDQSRPHLGVAGVDGLRTVEIATGDGLKLLAWYLPAEPGKPVLLYLHGNGGNLDNRVAHLRAFAATGWGLLFLEWRGYGGNPGNPSEAGFVEDAQGAMGFLGAEGVAPKRVVVYGESIGTGIATRLAATYPVAALLLESPYTSIRAIARQHFPYIPVGLLMRDPFELLPRIAAVKAPVLVMQGGRDEVVPPAMGRAVFAAITAPKDFWLAPAGGHNDLMSYGVAAAAIAFVKQHVPGG